MEVKANNAVPLWVSHLLARYNVPLGRFSKYCAGVARLQALGPSTASGDFAGLT